MTRLLALVLVILSASTAIAAKRKLSVDVDTAEGKLLKQLTDEADPAKKLAGMEEFAAKHPAHESATWVLGEMTAAYSKAGQFSKAIAAGEKVFAADPEDLAIAQEVLKAAEASRDPAQIRKWALAASAAARRVAAAPKPAAEDEAETWKANVAFATHLDKYCDYALFALALQSPAQRIEIGELLASHSPASDYNKQLLPQMFIAYQQAGNHQKALAIAEQEAANDDMLIYAASKFYEQKDKAKATKYAKALLEHLAAKPAPQGVAEADWTRNKNLKLGLAHWMLGVLASNDQKWAEADTNLRAALPYIKDNKDLAAETLFHLGLANYRLGDTKQPDKARIVDALKFSNQCAAIPGPYQAPARKNAAAIRTQYRIQ